MSVISEPFPRPPQVVAAVFDDLTRVAMLTGMLGGRNNDENDLIQGELDQYGDLDLLPRPWDPPTCPPSVRGPLWNWLDDVAAWLNGDYAWHTERCVPTCWPAHPHLVHELAMLACLRWQAGQAITADPLEEWHRWALPSFADRMRSQLGPNGCPPGKHTPWPAHTRYQDFVSEPQRAVRQEIFARDTTAGLRIVT